MPIGIVKAALEATKSAVDGVVEKEAQVKAETTVKPKLHPEVEKALQEKGEDWLVAAMVEGSIGYHSPKSARMQIREYLKGDRQDWCERCLACFEGDLEKMLLYDIQCLRRVEEYDPERVARIVEFCKAVEKLDDVEQTTIGLMYPTLGV